MTRKKLPNAIPRRGELWGIAAVAAAIDEEVAEPRSAPHNGAAAEKSTPTGATGPLVAAPIRSEAQAAQRRSHARRIVERHKVYAAMGGLFPLAIVNVAGVTAIIMRMVKQLSDLYQVPFQQDRTRSAIIGLMGGAVPTGLAAATASTLVFVVPGSGLVGLAVSSLTAASFTRGIGLFFVERFENGAMSLGGVEAKRA